MEGDRTREEGRVRADGFEQPSASREQSEEGYFFVALNLAPPVAMPLMVLPCSLPL
jgi:hypothetical protein